MGPRNGDRTAGTVAAGPGRHITRAAVKEGGREGAEGGGVIQDMYCVYFLLA